MLKTLTQRCLTVGLQSQMAACSISIPRKDISTSVCNSMPYERKMGPKNWPRYNNKIFPVQTIEEEPRPAYVCHYTGNIKYSPDKMWWVACLVRGMTVDEAVKQLDYVRKKGAGYVKKTILEAQELAVKEHNVEYRSNLWVAESFTTKGLVVKGLRRHARQRFGMVEYKHCHYYVRLEEGPPPAQYYPFVNPDGPTLLQMWIKERRQERIWGAI